MAAKPKKKPQRKGWAQFNQLRTIKTSYALKRKLADEADRTGRRMSDIVRCSIDACMRDPNYVLSLQKRTTVATIEPGPISVRLNASQEAFLTQTAETLGVPISTAADMLIGDILFGRVEINPMPEAADASALFD